MNEELEKFIADVIKEYEDLLANSYRYTVQNGVGKVNVGKDIFNEMLKCKAWPPGVTVNTIFHNGVHLVLSEYIGSNVVETYKFNYYQGALGGNPPIHSCFTNIKRYVGFTKVYDYCTICDKKTEIKY